jgi:hypothetical protein
MVTIVVIVGPLALVVCTYSASYLAAQTGVFSDTIPAECVSV